MCGFLWCQGNMKRGKAKVAWEDVCIPKNESGLGWSDVVDWLLPIAKRNNVISIFGRMIVAAMSYFVWQERNNRVHRNGERKPEQLSKIVVDMVRLKLALIRFKKKVRIEQMRRTWKISSIISDGC
ncbi:hypothetical protein Tco_1116910 [Tanacetum coccineum]